jgi:hypothetical protein
VSFVPKPRKTFVGMRYGNRVVTGIAGKNEKGHTLYQFQCDCGHIGVSVSKKILRNPRFCDACKPTKQIDMTGQSTSNWEVVESRGTNKHGAYQYLCRCLLCGAERIWSGCQLRSKNESQCAKCRSPHVPTPQIDIVGQTINGWQVIEQCGTNGNGAILYRCLHTACGCESIKTGGSICHCEIDYCKNCPPPYTLENKGTVTVGILQDGTQFLIDSDMAEKVSESYWRKNSNGYIVSKQSGRKNLLLHRFVLGVGGNVIVDHINRDKTDNRRENLREVNTAQNASNKSLQSNNTTGYVGVCLLKRKQLYQSSIGCFQHRLTLGAYKDIEKAAAAHNIAAAFLFGDYVGHWNDVPEQSEMFISEVKEKCRRFKQIYGGEQVG